VRRVRPNGFIGVEAGLGLPAGIQYLIATLDAIALAKPHVAIGSYPTWDNTDYRVKLTIEHVDANEAEAVTQLLKTSLAKFIVREG
jgi:hypothetical protein